MNYSRDIRNIRRKFFRLRFENELEYLKQDIDNSKIDSDNENNSENNENEEENWLVKRIDQLQSIISNFDNKNKEIDRSSGTNITETFDEINEQLYRKAWSRLPSFHKMVKIKEYLNELIDDKDEREKLLKEIEKNISNKKLNTKKSIGYSSKDKKILSMSVIKLDKKTNNYYLNI